MNRLTYFALFIFFGFFSIKFFETSLRDYTIKLNGEEKIVKILSNGNCGRSGGTIKVLLNDKSYSLNIGINDCISGKYQIGNEISVLYGAQYDYIILSEGKMVLGLYMSLAFFLLPLYCLFKIIKNK
jgi:hypothetical protein